MRNKRGPRQEPCGTPTIIPAIEKSTINPKQYCLPASFQITPVLGEGQFKCNSAGDLESVFYGVKCFNEVM